MRAKRSEDPLLTKSEEQVLRSLRSHQMTTLSRRSERPVHCVAKSFVQSDSIEWQKLYEQHGSELVHGIDPEQRAGRAVPEEFSNHAVVLFCIGGRTRAHREVDPKTNAAFARQPLTIGHAVGEMARGHEAHRFAFENSHAAELTAVQQHPRKTQIVVERRRESV